jgi:hypothetical protein
MKKAVRSRRVSRVDLHPLVLWRNRQTEANLVLRLKPRNRRGDFEAQITKPQPVWRPKPSETVTSDFEAKPPETIATGFKTKQVETVATSFEAQIDEKPSEWF